MRGEQRRGRRIVNLGQPYHDYYKTVFRGYWEDDKCKRKDGQVLKDFERVKYSSDLFGVFLEDIVMIDVDDMKQSIIMKQILDEKRVSYLWQKTDRGMHFIFHKGRWFKALKDKTNIMLAVGLYADIKCHSVDGTKLVKEGRPRELLRSEYFNELAELPAYLVPVGETEEFLALRDGDGRNEKLYCYILTLLRHGIEKEDVKETIRLINSHIFADSFTDAQLNTILRDEAFPTNNQIYIYPQNGSKTPSLDYELFCKKLIDDFKISKINELIYYKNDGIYQKLTDENLEFAIMDLLKNTKSQMRKECKPYVRKYSEIKEVEKADLILFNNGVYSISTKKLIRNNQDYVFFNKLKVNYCTDHVEMPIVEKFLNDISCGDATIRKLLLQMVGYSLIRSNPYQVFFFLDGNGKNGKSVLFDFIKYCVGENNTSSLSIHNLNDKYGVGALRDKLLNVGDDVPQDYIQDTSILKKAVSGETILVEEKFKDKEPLNFQGKLIFSGNGIPRFGDKSDGLMRRIITIPMKAKFVDKVNRDVNFKDKLLTKENAEYFIYLCVQEIDEVLEHGFVECEAAKTAKDNFEKSNNNVYEYYVEHTQDGDQIDGRPVTDVYLEYRVWCEENGYKDMFAKNRFTNMLKPYGYITKQEMRRGQRLQVYHAEEAQQRM